MSRKTSIQKRLGKVRPPRVQITYEVEKGDAIEQKELPFVVGVLGDFNGTSRESTTRLKDRKFINVDMDNFDDVMTSIAPRISCHVPNRMTAKGGEVAIDLRFNSINDFRPEAIVQQIEPLRKLLEIRTRLADLRGKMIGNDKLEDLLVEVLSDAERLPRLISEEKEVAP